MDKYISFLCKGQYFALPIEIIEKIILYEEPIIVPETSDYILGYISYDEEPMPIIDLNRRFFDEKTTINELSKIIVVHWTGHRLGLLVDEVSNVQEFESSGTESDLEEAHESYIVDTFYDGESILLRVEIDKMFTGEAAAELRRLLN